MWLTVYNHRDKPYAYYQTDKWNRLDLFRFWLGGWKNHKITAERIDPLTLINSPWVQLRQHKR